MKSSGSARGSSAASSCSTPAPCASRRSTTHGTRPTHSRASIPRSRICRFTPDWNGAQATGLRTDRRRSRCRAAALVLLRPNHFVQVTSSKSLRPNHFVQVATDVVPFITDHLLSPAVRILKQLALEPFQVVQKPSLVSFQVPSPLEPPEPIGSRVILPSGLNIILYLILVADAGKS